MRPAGDIGWPNRWVFLKEDLPRRGADDTQEGVGGYGGCGELSGGPRVGFSQIDLGVAPVSRGYALQGCFEVVGKLLLAVEGYPVGDAGCKGWGDLLCEEVGFFPGWQEEAEGICEAISPGGFVV